MSATYFIYTFYYTLALNDAIPIFLVNCGFYSQLKRPFLSRHAAWCSLLLCIFYGGIIELLQGVVFTYRSADCFDWLFDIGGALLGLWFFSLFKTRYL